MSIGMGQKSMSIDTGAMPMNEMPVLIGTTYHPNWVRADKGPVYAATHLHVDLRAAVHASYV